MFKFLLNLIPDSLTNRLVNKYTTQGSLLLLYTLAQQGVIPLEAVKALEGVPQMLPWILGALGVYLILKLPKAHRDNQEDKRKHVLEMKKMCLEYKKADLEMAKVRNEAIELKIKNKELNNKLKGEQQCN